MTLRAILLHLNYLFWHKIYVFQSGWKRGVPTWQLIIHDLSKFLPSEFIPYTKHFFPVPQSKHSTTFNPFLTAFLKHIVRNPHHWEYWCELRLVAVMESNGQSLTNKIESHSPIPMIERYRLEMLADWDGTGMSKNGKNDTKEFYLTNRDKIQLHPITRDAVEHDLSIFPGAA